MLARSPSGCRKPMQSPYLCPSTYRATVALYGPITCRTDYKDWRNPRESSPRLLPALPQNGDWLTWQVALGIVRPPLFTYPGEDSMSTLQSVLLCLALMLSGTGQPSPAQTDLAHL